MKLDYEKIVQNFLYFHVLYLSVSYYFLPSLSEVLISTYYIIFLSPILFYLSTLISGYKYKTDPPETYFPSIINIILILASLAYITLTILGMLNSDH